MPEDSNASAPTELGHGDSPSGKLGANLAVQQVAKAQSSRPQHSEFIRKLLHMSPGLLPFALVLVPHSDPLDWVAQAVVVFFCVAGSIFFLSMRRTVQRAGEDNLLSTVISYPATVIATVLLFPAHVELTGVVVVILAFGDGAAYIFGKTFGKTKLPWNSDKSWIGTISFVLVSGPIASFAYWVLANPDERTWGVAVACGFVAALCGAIAESLPVKLTDNLRVGVSSLLAVTVAHYALAQDGLILF